MHQLVDFLHQNRIPWLDLFLPQNYVLFLRASQFLLKLLAQLVLLIIEQELLDVEKNLVQGLPLGLLRVKSKGNPLFLLNVLPARDPFVVVPDSPFQQLLRNYQSPDVAHII